MLRSFRIFLRGLSSPLAIFINIFHFGDNMLIKKSISLIIIFSYSFSILGQNVCIDSQQNMQIVNILDNAVKYSPEVPKIDVSTEIANNFIVIRIQDQGAGMSKAVLKKVFEKFYREHTGNIHNVKGHGLGLAYVKKIVEDHQGEVYAESEKDKGSSFYIKLPLI